MSIDVMKQALEAVDWLRHHLTQHHGCLHMNETASGIPAWLDKTETAIRAAIEQAQEPIAWVYQEGLEALKSGRPWTAYGSSGGGRIPLYLDAVARRVEPPAAESGAGFESLPASPNPPEQEPIQESPLTHNHLWISDLYGRGKNT